MAAPSESENNQDIPMEGPGLLSGMEGIDEKTDLDKIFDKMLDPKNIFHFTELNNGEITAFSSLGTIAEQYMKGGVLHKWLLINLQMRVSKGRKGKGEFVKITSRNPYPDAQPQQQSRFNIFRR